MRWARSLFGLASPETRVACWCGRFHKLGFWHDPTHGRIDRDIQETARDILGIPLNATMATARETYDWGRLTAIEETLQRRRRETTHPTTRS